MKEFPRYIIQWAVVGSVIRRLPVRRFSTSVVAACVVVVVVVVVVLGDFAHEVELDMELETSLSSEVAFVCSTEGSSDYT